MDGTEVLANADSEVFREESPAFYIYLGVVQPSRIVEAAKVDWVCDDDALLRDHQSRIVA